MVQSLPRRQRAEALLDVFINRSNSSWAIAEQEIAGRLLIALCPKCYRSLDDVLCSIAPGWDASVEQLPLYLADVFGRDVVVEAATRLEGEFPAGSREALALSTIRWWLTGRN